MTTNMQYVVCGFRWKRFHGACVHTCIMESSEIRKKKLSEADRVSTSQERLTNSLILDITARSASLLLLLLLSSLLERASRYS